MAKLVIFNSMKIFLVGFMGSGKTYWGKIWAKENHLDFFDLDDLVEENKNKSIAVIFDTDGEAQFRLEEAAALRTFENKDGCLVACGGGTPCFHDNMQWMNGHGTTIYLSATVQDIFERLLKEQHSRPLIKDLSPNDLFVFIARKLKERDPIYGQATVILPAGGLTTGSLEKIINT